MILLQINLSSFTIISKSLWCDWLIVSSMDKVESETKYPKCKHTLKLSLSCLWPKPYFLVKKTTFSTSIISIEASIIFTIESVVLLWPNGKVTRPSFSIGRLILWMPMGDGLTLDHSGREYWGRPYFPRWTSPDSLLGDTCKVLYHNHQNLLVWLWRKTNHEQIKKIPFVITQTTLTLVLD